VFEEETADRLTREATLAGMKRTWRGLYGACGVAESGVMLVRTPVCS